MSESLRETISRGSKSFFLASLFFPKKMRESCWVLYRWCRQCDDRIDRAADSAEAGVELAAMRLELAHTELARLCQKYSIPLDHPNELLNGFEKDVRGFNYYSIEEVEEYSYQVAGVVGLMMAKIMGASRSEALLPAKNMGIAMQLTNIARDIAEDYERGRIYLPKRWLMDSGVDCARLLDSDQREKLFDVVKRLLARADELYASGRSGLRYLPFRAAIAVSIASLVYQEIGRKILRQGPAAIDQRVYVTLFEKLQLVVRGFFQVRRAPLSLNSLEKAS